MAYERLFFQKTKDGEDAVDTDARWGLRCSSFPYAVGGDAKDLPQNDWGDEDGVEEYYPEEGLPLKSYDIDVELVGKGDGAELAERVDGFLAYLTGRDGTGCLMDVWSEHTGEVKRRVRFVKMDETPAYTTDSEGLVARIAVTLKVVW